MSERFWAKVDRNGPISHSAPHLGPCWIWTGARVPDGYGSFGWTAGRIVSAHRAAWMLSAESEVPSGLHVLHYCDVRLCVRKTHLFLGTNVDNMADRNAKGRQAKGSRHGRVLHPDLYPRGRAVHTSKLTEDQVRAIRMSPKSTRVLGAEYGVSGMTISQIKRRIIWGWLP